MTSPERDQRPTGLLSDVPFRLFVESVQDYAIFMLDTDGYVVSWNLGAERIKGYSAADIVGRHFSSFYTEEDLARRHPWNELEIARREGRHEEEGWRLRKDGTRFWASVVITAVRDDTGRLIGFGKVTRDLTERKRAEEGERQLLVERAARAEAEAANQAKSQFLATMSHELRTPLNAIIGYADLLDLELSGTLTEKQHVEVRRIRRSAQLLLSLITDVLNFTRLEAGRVDFRAEEVRVGPLISEVEALVLPQLQAKEISFTRETCQGDPLIRVDPEKLEQILLNLLTNAYKFTEPGGSIWLRCRADERHVEIEVQDTGRGIPEDRLEVIFEPFVQIDRHQLQQSQQGVGLGLAISRDLARAMGGELSVESRIGEGSTFILTVPRLASSPPS